MALVPPGTWMQTQYVALNELAQHAQRTPQNILGIATFAAATSSRSEPPLALPQIPIAVVPTLTLGNAVGTAEIWRAPGPLRSGRSGSLDYRANDQVLFGSLTLSETTAEPAGDSPDSLAGTVLERTTERAYSEVFQCLESVGFPHLIRVWNYLPDINRATDGTERYRQFNAARRRAFHTANRQTQGNVPAACVLGSVRGTSLTLYFLASKQTCIAVENPRQIAAYRYPAEYGASPPTFSRATLVPAAAPVLFISGTASIVGHTTMHVGDVLRQTRETVANIRALTKQANQHCGRPCFVAENFLYKVYLRHAADLAAVEHELRSLLGANLPVLFVQAEVCRDQLLVEIEAVSTAAPMAGC